MLNLTTLSSPIIKTYRHRLQKLYEQHTDFSLLLALFITFRLLTLLAFRPGGLVLDFSDFYWYRSFAELTRQGYYPYDTLWTTYPPLFPAVMIPIYQLSTLLPPWTSPNLWFTLLLGGFFLLFEIGNFVLLYLFSRKLHQQEGRRQESVSTSSTYEPHSVSTGSTYEPHSVSTGSTHEPHSVSTGSTYGFQQATLRPCWLYAMFFVPVYTLTGWFESYPLFFFLVSLYLLLEQRPLLSSIFTGIGFMIKLIPLILMPIAVQQLTAKRYHLGKVLLIPIPPPMRLASYIGLFLLTVVSIGLPFYLLNPALFFGPQLITAAREPWETVWALIDGNYNYGIIPLDMRDLAWTAADAPPTRIPWLWVTAITALIYGLIYTRSLDWQNPRQVMAFAAFTNCLFMLWSKGYSPQWLGWPLFFIALLLPNIRGVIYAVVLSIGNILEANVFFIMFPEEKWLLATIVINRTLMLTVLTMEFLWLIWPPSPRMVTLRAWGLTLWLGVLLIGIVPAGWQLGQSYFDSRLKQSPYQATITRLQNESVQGALLLNSHQVYDWFYPYLRHEYTLAMLDDYAPPNEEDAVQRRTTLLLDTLRAQTDVLWIYDADAAETTASETVLTAWLNGRPPAHIQDIDGGRLYLFILQ